MRRAVVMCLALIAFGGACSGTDAARPSSTSGPATTASRSTIAGTMTFGSGAECPHEQYCLPGLQQTYGLTFKAFVVTDAGGPKTVDALKNRMIDIGVLFTTSPQIAANGFVLLEDDRHLQPAENVTPIVRDDIVAAYGPDLQKVVDRASAMLTTGDLAELNRRVDVDGTSNAAVASDWLREKGLLGADNAPKTGSPVVVGSANFSESVTLAELYAQLLEANGYPVQRRLSIGNRSTYFPLLEQGQVGLVPEYSGSLLAYLDKNAKESSDPAAAHDALQSVLRDKHLTAFAAAPAENKNGIVVTGDTASRLGLKRVSDLGVTPDR